MTAMQLFNVFLWICGFVLLSYNVYLGIKAENYPAMFGWICSLFLYVMVVFK